MLYLLSLLVDRQVENALEKRAHDQAIDNYSQRRSIDLITRQRRRRRNVPTDDDQARDFIGRITHVTAGGEFAIFEGTIVFPRQDAASRFKVSVGDKVRVRAHYDADFESYQFERVDLLRDEDQQSLQSEVSITSIEAIDPGGGGGGRLANGSAFSASCVDLGLKLLPGDWVRVTTGGENREIVHVEALRTRQVSDVVAETQRSGLLTNGPVFVPHHVIQESGLGDSVTIGSQLKLTIIESGNHPRCGWRATRVHECVPPSGRAGGGQETEDDGILNLKGSSEPTSVSVMPAEMAFARCPVGSRQTQVFSISSSGPPTTCLLSLTLLSVTAHYTIAVEGTPLGDVQFPLPLSPAAGGHVTNVRVELSAVTPGRNESLLKFVFDTGVVLRSVSSTVFEPDELLIDVKGVFEKKRRVESRRADRDSEWVLPGERPVFSTKAATPARLPHFPVPQRMRRAFQQREDMTLVCPELLLTTNAKTYSAKFHSLLHLEEMQEEEEMRAFDMCGVQMRPHDDFLYFDVPGLSEGRPSLLVGDRIIVRDPTDLNGSTPDHEAFIHRVDLNTIFLKFNHQFHAQYTGYEVDVQFVGNRSAFRKAHLAVDFSAKFPTWLVFPQWFEPKKPLFSHDSAAPKPLPVKREPALFGYGFDLPIPFCSPVIAGAFVGKPTRNKTNYVMKKQAPGSSAKPTNEESRRFCNRSLNERQQAAVCRILAAEGRPVPYILFGPPGTGKTITVVESILQVFLKLGSSRILACAPSNSAADLIVQRLAASGLVSVNDLVRFNAVNRPLRAIPEDVTSFCCNDMDELHTVSRYRIIVCTCTTAGNFYSLELKPGHFTHIFVDEAGQATEPETMIAIGLGAANHDVMIVLAGDPKQLGPVLRSTTAEEHGLGESLLLRLSQRSLYARDESLFAKQGNYNPKVMTKLVDNYRSHSSLLLLPSKLFYDDELIAKADDQLVKYLEKFHMLPNKDGFPLIFHGIRGNDMREQDSPSWFNAGEAVWVMKYIKQLLDAGYVEASGIGVITPYRKQVEKIRQFLETFEVRGIKVGSVEEFQGQERPVIILSTVRSDETKVQCDVYHNLGFVSSPRRFNVAVTRAQALLIVIGNPFILANDPHWSAFVQYALMNGGYTGCDPPAHIATSDENGNTL